MRNFIKKLYSNKTFNIVMTVPAVLFLPLVYQCLAQFLLKRSFSMTVEYLWIYRRALLVGTVFLVLVTAALTLLTRRAVIPAAIIGASVFALSTGHFFKLCFREEALMPSDLFLIKEAGIVAGELDLFITREIVLFAAFLILTTAVLFRIKLPKSGFKYDFLIRAALSALLIFTAVFYTKSVIYNDDTLEKLGAGMGSLNNEETYYKGTFVTAFIRFTKDAFHTPPDGFSDKAVKEIYENMPVTDNGRQKQTDIIVVMLEGYFHLDNYEQESYSVNLTENYDRIAKEGVSGNHLSYTFGGGTADIEFEALTGYSKSLLPDIGTAYNTVVKDGFLSYVSYLKSNNYKAIAIHSYLGSLYNRVSAYKNMGFDEFYQLEDFVNPDMAGQYISDRAAMEKIIEVYDQETEQNEGGVFIHTVTMQNHAPIENRFSPREQVEVYSDRLNDEDKYTLANLATCQYLTDEAIGYLVDYFRNSEREVVILFFGDHQVKASRVAGADPLERTDFYEKYTKEEQVLKQHTVPFLMWSNRQATEGIDLGLISTELLLPNMLNIYDVIRPDYFDYLYRTQSVIKGYIPSADMTVNGDNSISYGLTERQARTRNERSYIEYDAVLGKKIIKNYYYN